MFRRITDSARSLYLLLFFLCFAFHVSASESSPPRRPARSSDEVLQIWAWPLLLHQFLPPVRPVTKLCYSWWVQMHPQEFKKSLLKLNFCYSCCLYFYIYKRNTPLSLALPLCASPAGRSVEVEGSGGRPAGRGKAKLPPVTSHLLTCPL